MRLFPSVSINTFHDQNIIFNHIIKQEPERAIAVL